MSHSNLLAAKLRLALGSLSFLVACATLAPSPVLAQYYGDDDDRYYENEAPYGDYRDDQHDDREQDFARSGYEEEDVPDTSFFYEELADEGRWISHHDYGYVWSPHNVDDDWRPYTRGSWAYTDDYGWYWVSDERFGWATYHYGRWFYDERNGWLWVPGTTWGPAWVAWRSSDDYLGWAPLPPDAYWNDRAGLRYDAQIYEGPRYASYWSFVEPRYFTTSNVYRYCAPRHRARTIIYRTRPQTHYSTLNAQIFNGGISLSFVERHIGAPIARHRVYTTQGRHARGFDRRAGDVVRSWRPDFKNRAHARPQHATHTPPSSGRWRNVDRPASSARSVWRPKFNGPGNIQWEKVPGTSTSHGSAPRPPAYKQGASKNWQPGFKLDRDRAAAQERDDGDWDERRSAPRPAPGAKPLPRQRAVRNFDPPAAGKPLAEPRSTSMPPPRREVKVPPPPTGAPPPKRGRQERPQEPSGETATPPPPAAGPAPAPAPAPAAPAKKAAKSSVPRQPPVTWGPSFGHGQPSRNAYGAPQ